MYKRWLGKVKKMKRLLLAPLLITLLLASCSTKKKYNSYREANDACKEWADKGGSYILKTLYGERKNTFGEIVIYPSLEWEVPIRFCQEEKQTKQILGIQIVNRKANVTYQSSKSIHRLSMLFGTRLEADIDEVKKNFYY